MEEAKLIFYDFALATANSTPKTYDAAAKTYAAAITKLPASVRTAIKDDPIQALQLVDPATNTIGYFAIMDVFLSGYLPPSAPRDLILDSVVQFLLNFDPIQIRYVGSQFRYFLEGLSVDFPPTVVVELLAHAILRMDPSGSTFTSTHILLAKLAYNTNCMEPALRVLDADILFYPRNTRLEEPRRLCDADLEPCAYMLSTGLTDKLVSSDILHYHLLQAMIYISRRDWRKSQTALEKLIGHPTKDKGVSKLMLESYKKWTLIGLLKDGRPPNLPHYVTGATKVTFNGLSEPYNKLASLFTTENASALKEEAFKGRRIWEQDRNLALVEEVISSYQKWQIINLRRIYRQVSIAQLRETTLSANTAETLKSDDEVLALVSEMIESGMLKGQLQVGPTAEESYLTFHEEHDLMTEAEFAAEVARSHSSIEALTKQYRATNERLSSTKDYARHVVREQKRMEKDMADAGVGFDANIEDEDLMTGVLGAM
ncbi:hypothetical protein ACQKWADRAFT_303146 [Trichoderma austrokoningii]